MSAVALGQASPVLATLPSMNEIACAPMISPEALKWIACNAT